MSLLPVIAQFDSTDAARSLDFLVIFPVEMKNSLSIVGHLLFR